MPIFPEEAANTAGVIMAAVARRVEKRMLVGREDCETVR